MKYGVFEKDKLCDAKNFKVHESWDNAVFPDLDQAVDYAIKWLGAYAPNRETLASMKPYDYSGYGSKIQIKVISSANKKRNHRKSKRAGA